MNSRAALLVALTLAAVPFAASRARYGGVLQLAFAGKPAEAEPLYADTPAEAALLQLTSRALCLPPFTLSRPQPGLVHLEVPPGVKPADVAASLKRVQTEGSPYRSVLAPVTQITATATGVDLKLAYAWPDLEAGLCHPALALAGAGPFKLGNAPGRFTADPAFAAGRPYLDEVVVSSTDERGAERLFSQRRAQLALGLAPKDASAVPLPFTTGLLFSSSLPPSFRAAFESTVERADLTRFFVHAPAAPLLPAAAGAKPAPLNPPREITLLFDASLEDQRAVAARLQVRLHPMGYRVALKPLARRELRSRWEKNDYELMLFSVLLPSKSANALALVLEVAHATDLQAKHLPALGALADEQARDEKAKDLMVALAPQLAALPLYVQGLALQTGPQVQGLKLDASGLPKLDDVFLGAE